MKVVPIRPDIYMDESVRMDQISMLRQENSRLQEEIFSMELRYKPKASELIQCGIFWLFVIGAVIIMH